MDLLGRCADNDVTSSNRFRFKVTKNQFFIGLRDSVRRRGGLEHITSILEKGSGTRYYSIRDLCKIT
jgi:hypothetical protein